MQISDVFEVTQERYGSERGSFQLTVDDTSIGSAV